MARAGRREKSELKRYLPLVITRLGKARPIDIKRFFDRSITPASHFKVSYNSIVKYCELLVDEGVLVRQKVLDNIDKTRKDGRRRWTVVFYKVVPTGN